MQSASAQTPGTGHRPSPRRRPGAAAQAHGTTAGIAAGARAFVKRHQLDGSTVITWLLGCPLIVYLSLKGGGYDSIVRNQLGLAIWWFVLAGALAGVLPLTRLNRASYIAGGVFLAFTGWMALSLTWSESPERTLADVGRVATFAGVLVLALLTRGPRATRRTVAAVGTGIAIVALIALASRIQPGWFPESAQQTDDLFFSSSTSRLAYPLNYWNGVAILIAIGLPLVLHVATSVRSTLVAALSAAALPAMALTSYLTYSRAGVFTALAALVVFIAFAHDRIPRLVSLTVTGAGSAILIAAVAQRPELADGVLNSSAALEQGDEMLRLTLAVCAGVGLVQAALTLFFNSELRPAATQIPHRAARIATIAAAVLAMLAAFAFDAPGHASNLWDEFKRSDSTGAGAERLQSFSGNMRYELWEIAATQYGTDPFKGTGSGTYENWFHRDKEAGGFVRDAHSLYMETLAELGIAGLALLLAFIVAVFAAAGILMKQAAAERRTQLAAALAGCTAFCLGAGVDWMWELAVVPVAFLLLAASLLGAGGPGGRRARGRHARLGLAPRLGLGVAAVAAIVAISIPLITSSLVRQSQAQAAAGNFAGALASASDAAAINPAASTPELQRALVLEAVGSLDRAAVAARTAAGADPGNWRPWQALARIEAKRGNLRAATRAASRSAALN